MRKILVYYILGMVGMGAAAFGEASKPNILYIMSDDHAAHAIGVYGGRLAPLNPTPALDRLAAEGIFAAAFATNNVAMWDAVQWL